MHVQAISPDAALPAPARAIPAAAAGRRTRLYTFCRYATAFIIIFYGFAKVFKLQFVVTPSTADTPLRLVYGQGLAWYFFGYSSAYAALITLAEIGGGALLLWRRTTLAGALLLLPLMLNVLMLDLAFQISAIGIALLLLAMIFYILSWHTPALLTLLRTAPDHVYGCARSTSGAAGTAATWLLRAAVVAIPAYVTWAGHAERIRPVPLEGTWSVARKERPAGEPARMSHLDFARSIYIENWGEAVPRAVLRDGDTFTQTQFVVDSAAHAVRIAEIDRFRPGSGKPLFEGTYTRAADHVILSGNAGGAPLRLELVPVRR